MKPPSSGTSSTSVAEAVVLVSSGYTDGPAQAVFRWLKIQQRNAHLIVHPLVQETDLGHVCRSSLNGHESTTVRRRPHRPPLSYLLDLTAPFLPPRCDLWIGFNCIATFQGLLMKRLGRARRVVHWNVDFVPQRFGNTFLNFVYEHLDSYCWEKSDVHVELTKQALKARANHYGVPVSSKDEIVPMGSWFSATNQTVELNHSHQIIVFVGHLVPRMGLEAAVRAMPTVLRAFPGATLRIIGDGPESERLRALTRQLELDDAICFAGFLERSEDVEEELSRATVAIAPYELTPDNFTAFADPGKLKMYAGAGLPILTTNVAPFAQELFAVGAAEMILPDENSISVSLIRILEDGARWNTMRSASNTVGQRYSWSSILENHAFLR